MRNVTASRETPVVQTMDERLWRCWFSGMGIGQTIQAIKYSYGERLAFETVRQAFIRCCAKFSGGNID